jgi:hypothetical protein
MTADATGSADAWAVGWGSNDISSAPAVPIALRWNGTSWQSVPLPGTESTALYAVDALSPSNVWAVGNTVTSGSGGRHRGGGGISLVLRWNGSSWVREAAPNATLNGAAAVGPNTFWAVGNRFELTAYEERTFTMVRT